MLVAERIEPEDLTATLHQSGLVRIDDRVEGVRLREVIVPAREYGDDRNGDERNAEDDQGSFTPNVTGHGRALIIVAARVVCMT